MSRCCVASAVIAILLGLDLQAGLGAEPIRIDGSSTVYPITRAVAAEFARIEGDAATLQVAFSGTTAGFRKFCAGEIDIADASRPILAEEMAACRKAGIGYVELPIAFDAVTIVAHATNRYIDCLSIADLKRIWEPAAQGKLTRWSQINSLWPDLPLKLFGPGPDSGTFDYFTEAVVGAARAQRRDFTPSEDDEVLAAGIAAEPGSLGYLPLAYAIRHADRFKIVAVSDRTPQCVVPTELTIHNGQYRPLSRPLFLYVARRAAAAARPEVADFIRYYLSRAGDVATLVGYVSLPVRAYDLAEERFKAGTTGTVFGGVPQVGLRVRDLLGREPKS